jgi:hypothetical protein
MKNLVVVMLVCFGVAAFAQEKKSETMKQANSDMVKLHGYVVDQMCAKGMAKKGNPMERAAKHTKECALEEACAASGFGVFYGDNKWIKFDENGDKLAKAMFEKSKKDKDFMVDVSGEMKGDRLVVASLSESKMASDEMKMPAKKEESHEGHKH